MRTGDPASAEQIKGQRPKVSNDDVRSFTRDDCVEHLSEVVQNIRLSHAEASALDRDVEICREYLDEAEQRLAAYENWHQDVLRRLTAAASDQEEAISAEFSDCGLSLTSARRRVDDCRERRNAAERKAKTASRALKKLTRRRSLILQRLRELEGVPASSTTDASRRPNGEAQHVRLPLTAGHTGQ